MASIRVHTSKAGKKTYKVTFRDGGRQSSRSFVTRKAAERFQTLVDVLGPARALAELAGEQKGGLTVDELAEKWIAWKRPNVSERVATEYWAIYKNWISARIGTRRANSIDERDVQGLVDELSTQLAPKTVAERHMVLHSIFKFGAAKTRQLVDYNPCTETMLPRRQKAPLRSATLAEFKALHGAAVAIGAKDAADLMFFIAATGWRWSEAAALPVREVVEWEKDGAVVMLATVSQVFRRGANYSQTLATGAKSQAGLRTVKVPASAAAVVRRRLIGKGPDDLVFTSPAGGRWIQSNFLSRDWERIVEAAQLDRRVTPHMLRHLHVALLNQAGASLVEMQRRLGHEDVQTTVNVYGRGIDDIDAGVLDRLDALLTSETPVAGEVIAGHVVLELED